MTSQHIAKLKIEFRNSYFRYLQDDARAEGYTVDFETEFAFWIENREA